MERFLSGLARWLIVMALPLFIVLTCARLLVGGWYPRFEYGRAGFPPDSYGLAPAQRLELAQGAIAYLNAPGNAADAAGLLEAWRLPSASTVIGGNGVAADNGAGAYSAAEVSHMVDVKRVMDRLWVVGAWAGIVAGLGLAALVARRSTRAGGWWALMAGGLWTALLLAGLGLFVLVAWNSFFVLFHSLFFAAGTWTFDYTDTLIRLFPARFWFDAGVIVVAGSLSAALAAAGAGAVMWRRTRA